MELAFGIIVGVLAAMYVALAAFVYFMQRDLKNLAGKTRMESEYSALLKENLSILEADLNLESKYRQESNRVLDERLKKLESVDVPEHLTFTQQQIIKKEVGKRLEQIAKIDDINFLENYRERALDEHNRRYSRTQ